MDIIYIGTTRVNNTKSIQNAELVLKLFPRLSLHKNGGNSSMMIIMMILCCYYLLPDLIEYIADSDNLIT